MPVESWRKSYVIIFLCLPPKKNVLFNSTCPTKRENLHRRPNLFCAKQQCRRLKTTRPISAPLWPRPCGLHKVRQFCARFCDGRILWFISLGEFCDALWRNQHVLPHPPHVQVYRLSHLGAPSANVPPFRSMQNPWGWTINIININILEVFVEVIDGRTDGQRTYNFGVPCGQANKKASLLCIHTIIIPWSIQDTSIRLKYLSP